MRHSILFLATFALGCGGNSAPLPIYLGHVATTSGPGREAGDKETLGIRLAVEELLKDNQDKLGGRPVHVKHADARGNIDAFEGQAVRLVTLGRAVALYGGNTADEVLRIDRSRAPVVTPLGWRPRGASENVFCIGLSPAVRGTALARVAVLDLGVTAVHAVIDKRGEDYRALADAFKSECQKALGEQTKPATLAWEETIIDKDTKLAELAKTIDAKKVGAILFAGTAADFRDWRSVVKGPPVLLFGGTDGSLRDGEGAIVATAFSIDKESPRTVEFAQKFRDAFKEEPDVHAALAYDGIRILVEAMRRAQSPSGERFLEELKQTKDYTGLTGPITIGATDNRPIFVGRLEGNSLTVLRRWTSP